MKAAAVLPVTVGATEATSHATRWARAEVVQASRKEVQLHLATVAGGTALCAALFALASALKPHVTEPSDYQCSYGETDPSCSCDAERTSYSAGAKLLQVFYWCGLVLVSICVLIYRIMVASLGAPRRPWEARFWIVFLPPAYFALTVSAGGEALTGGANLYLAVYVLSMVAGMARWRKGSIRPALLCVAPFALISVVSGVWVFGFGDRMPELVRDYPNHVVLVSTLGEISDVLFRQLMVRLLARLVRGRWPWPQQSLLIRLVASMGSTQRIALFVSVAAFKGYRAADLTPWHPLMLPQYFYVASQLAIRQNVLTLARGRLRCQDRITTKERQSPFSAMFGSSRDLRYVPYLAALATHAAQWDFGTGWLANCDGEYVDLFNGGDVGLLWVLLGVEVLTDVLWALSQRHLCGSDSIFKALWVTAPVLDEVLLLTYLTMSSTIGLGVRLNVAAQAMGVRPA